VSASPSRIVTFRLGEHLFAAEIASVERVLRHEGARAIPDMPDWMEGVIDHAGAVVPLIDLRRRFGLPATPPGPQSRILVCSSGGAPAALLVDGVLDVRPVASDGMSDPPALFRGLAAEYLKGLTRRDGQLVVVLDMDRLLVSTDLLDFQGAAPEPAR
jgi:purine-binding chemotaxis protein CheW